MSRLDIKTPSKAQMVVEHLYRSMEHRIEASPPGLCPIDMALNFLNLCHAQTCGKCVPCRVGLGQLSDLLHEVLDGRPSLDILQLIEDTAEVIVASADCAIGVNAAQLVLAQLRKLPEYAGAFVDKQEAFLRLQPGTLLIVVDTNRPDFVEAPQVLESCNRVAVIDHHRRAASYIENAALNFHEPYASSASELVTELLQYLCEPSEVLREEAEALLAGIVLDTKHFTLRTGGRTFEAAAFLRRAGADTTDVQRYFQNELSDVVTRYDILRRAEILPSGIAVAAIPEDGVDRVSAAQAADELLTLRGVKASFVLCRKGAGVILSGRSLGEVNVQVILEALGGGGNSTTAGGQIAEGDVAEVRAKLLDVIEAYFEK